MRSMYIKPENALQRAEELIQVNAPSEALSVLQETLVSRRVRGAPIQSLENVAMKFIELAVDLNKSKIAREGLHLFKNLAQNTSVAAVEKVIKKFIDRSEYKLTEAQRIHESKTASALAAVAATTIPAITSDDEGVEDLDTNDTFDSMYNAMINSLEDPDSGTAAMAVAAAGSLVPTKASKRNRESVTSRLKFLWDAYRTVLDVLRNNARLELLYQYTVAQAFKFCEQYSRKNEFRRLCETLRTHLASLPRHASHHNGINLSDPEILQRFLDTRFLQLQTANDMELWQESFRSVEDIYHLLVMAGNLIAPNATTVGLLPTALFTNKRYGTKMTQLVAQYYQKLTQIFTVSEDRMFLAAAWNKYYAWVSQTKSSALVSDTDSSLVPSHVVLSALAAPVFSEPSDPDTFIRLNRKNRLAQMLGMPNIPDRQTLLTEAGNKSILAKVPESVRAIYHAMETDFYPLTIAESVRPHLRVIESDTQLAMYVTHLRTVIVGSVLKAISTLYTRIALSTVLDLTSVDESPLDLFTLEKVIMMGNQKHEFRIKLNYLSQMLEFTTDAVAPNLDALFDLPLFEDYIDTEKHEVFERAREMADEEHKSFLERQDMIEKKKEEAEAQAQRKLEEQAKERALKANMERESLQRKMAEEARERELARLKQEQEAVKKAEARKIAEAFKVKSGLTIADEDLDSLDTTAIFTMQAEQLRTEREQLEAKMKSIVKKADYNERAIRKEEIPLLHKYRDEQKVLNAAMFHDAWDKLVQDAKDRHANAIAVKHRMARMVTDFQAYQAMVQANMDERLMYQTAKVNEQIEVALQERRKSVRQALREKLLMQQKQKEEQEEQRRLAQESIRNKPVKDAWVPSEPTTELPWKQVTNSSRGGGGSYAAATAKHESSGPSSWRESGGDSKMSTTAGGAGLPRGASPALQEDNNNKYVSPKRAGPPLPRFNDEPGSSSSGLYRAPSSRPTRPTDSPGSYHSRPSNPSTPLRSSFNNNNTNSKSSYSSSVNPQRTSEYSRSTTASGSSSASTPSHNDSSKYVPPSSRNKNISSARKL